MEIPHPFQDRRNREIDAMIIETALAGAMDIRDSVAAEEPGPYSLPIGAVPRGIDTSRYAERVGATAEDFLGILGCHDVEVDHYITQFTNRVKPRRQCMPLSRPSDSGAARVMFRHKSEIAN